jgi:hypothetical protein
MLSFNWMLDIKFLLGGLPCIHNILNVFALNIRYQPGERQVSKTDHKLSYRRHELTLCCSSGSSSYGAELNLILQAALCQQRTLRHHNVLINPEQVSQVAKGVSCQKLSPAITACGDT